MTSLYTRVTVGYFLCAVYKLAFEQIYQQQQCRGLCNVSNAIVTLPETAKL
jgi:hypothetical protein